MIATSECPTEIGGRATVDAEMVRAALETVIDPELDEPITTLRFVSSIRIADGDVEVRLRLPTPQCAPNFAFLMASDARRALRGLSGIGEVSVSLEDHYTGAEINGALARGEGFAGAFPGETSETDLESLRRTFLRKALLARQGRICERLLAAGAGEQQLLAARVRDLPDGEDVRRSLQLRAQLGIASGPEAPAFVLADGQALSPGQLRRWLRVARLVRTSLEANGEICRSLLAFRHQLGDTDGQATQLGEDAVR
jgi:metal-sulfur cluster biosynthetic enzyme